MRIDRPIRLEITTEPLQELGSATVLGDLDRIMDANQTGPSCRLFVDPCQMRQRGMAAPTVGVNHNRIGGIQRRIVGGPTVAKDLDLGLRYRFLDCIGKDSAAGIMLVGAKVMAPPPGDKDDFLWCVRPGFGTCCRVSAMSISRENLHHSVRCEHSQSKESQDSGCRVTLTERSRLHGKSLWLGGMDRMDREVG